MATTRRDFLRGLLASTAILPVAAKALPAGYPVGPTIFRSEMFRWEMGVIPEDWRSIVRAASLDFPGLHPGDIIDVPVGPPGPQSLWLIQWGETSSHYENWAEAS